MYALEYRSLQRIETLDLLGQITGACELPDMGTNS